MRTTRCLMDRYLFLSLEEQLDKKSSSRFKSRAELGRALASVPWICVIRDEPRKRSGPAYQAAETSSQPNVIREDDSYWQEMRQATASLAFLDRNQA